MSFYFQLSGFQFFVCVFSSGDSRFIYVSVVSKLKSCVCTFYVHVGFILQLRFSLLFYFKHTFICMSCMFAYICFVMHVRLYGIVREFR